MSIADYLVDTSALVRIIRQPPARSRWQAQVEAGLIAVCPAVELEMLVTARSRTDRDVVGDLLRAAFSWVPMPLRAFERALEVQAELTDRGAHRSAGPMDLLIASTAEDLGLVLLHYDRYFDQVGAVTGQPTRWLAEPGTLS
ncbi:MAG: PIN domain nuclease [Phycicoccus sp.]